jgi:hypothetical protein
MRARGRRPGIVYGLYLTLSTWILWFVAARMSFFADACHLPSLQITVRREE